MNKTLTVLLGSIFSISCLAATPSFTEESFCSDRTSKSFIKELAADDANLLSFRNHGGLLNGGVCWWHSRFQRNALYLTIFKPELQKPSIEEAKVIIKKIRHAKNVVTIPGYANFKDFSIDFANQIQRELEKWQKGDGIIRFAWIDGLRGKSRVEAEKLKSIMDKMFDEIDKDNLIEYNKLQIAGIDSHAWLVVGMEKLDDGYNLKILDSNFNNELQTYRYRIGDRDFNYHGYFKFVPYLEKTRELHKIERTIKKYCESK
jgi:hypothetical protein